MDIAHFWTFDAQSLSLTIDTLSRGALVVDPMVERPITVERHAHQSPQFPVGIFDTATAFGKLRMIAGLCGDVRKEQRTAEPLGTVPIGVLERKGRMHGQAFGTHGRAIGIAGKRGMSMLIERNGSDAAMQRGALIDVPGIEGSIGGDVGRIGIEGQHAVAVQGAEVGDIAFIERLGEIRHHHIAINGIGAGGDPGAIAKQADLFFFRAAVGLHLIAALFDAQAAIRVALRDVGDIKAAFDVDVGVVLAHPGVNVLDIEGHRFAQSGNFRLESRHRGLQEVLQQSWIKQTQFLREPEATRKRFLDSKAIGGTLDRAPGGSRVR